MTYEAALKVIIKNLAVAIHDWDDPTDEYQREQAEGFQKAKEALEKQIPKKIKRIGVTFCPICNAAANSWHLYCHKCGQRLDWSKK